MNQDESTWLASQLPPLSCYCADHAQLSLLLSEVTCCHVLLNEMLFNHLRYFMLPEIFYVLLKTNCYASYAFLSYFILLLLVFHKSLEPNSHFTLQIDSTLHDCVSGPNYEHQDSAVFKPSYIFTFL